MRIRNNNMVYSLNMAFFYFLHLRMRNLSGAKVFGFWLLGVLSSLMIFLVLAYGFMLFWNWFMPALWAAAPILNYIQAAVILFVLEFVRMTWQSYSDNVARIANALENRTK